MRYLSRARLLAFVLVLLHGSGLVFAGNVTGPGDYGHPDSALWLPNEERLDAVPLQAIVQFERIPDLSELAGVVDMEALPFDAVLVTFADPLGHVLRDDLDAEELKVVIDMQMHATRDGIERLRTRSDVIFVEPNHLLYLPEDQAMERYAKASRSQAGDGPEDELAELLGGGAWYDSQINLAGAHALTTGASTVRIAILDTGRSFNTPHPDLASRWVQGVEYDSALQDGDARNPSDYHHGIAVAGTASRVCPSCALLNVKVSSSPGTGGGIALDSVGRGIFWAVNNGARVINMSFEGAGTCSNSFLLSALQYAENNGVVAVAAAGNTAGAQQRYPANCSTVVSVAAVNQSQGLTAYSNRNGGGVTHVNLAAPAGDAPLSGGSYQYFQQGVGCSGTLHPVAHPVALAILVPWTTTQASGGNHCRRYMAGTSFAAPHVAGVAGLMLTRNPNLTPAQVRATLSSTTQFISCSSGSVCGSGLLNAAAAVQAAIAVPAPGDPPPVPHAVVNCNGLNCTFNGSGSTDNQGVVAHEWLLPGQAVRRGSVVTHFVPGYGQHFYTLRVVDTAGQSSQITQSFFASSSSIQPLAGVYQNPDRPGSTVDFYRNTQNQWVAYWNTFDTSGQPVWYMSDTSTVSSGQWSAPLYRVNATTGGGTQLTTVGTINLAFSNSSSAWLSWTLNGVSGGERFNRTGTALSNSGLWHVPGANPSGIGVLLQHESSAMRGKLLTYRRPVRGNTPIWMYGQGPSSSNPSFNLVEYRGVGLCPGCGGSDPAIAQSANGNYSGSINLWLTGGNPSEITMYWPWPTTGVPTVLWTIQGSLQRLAGP